MPGIAWVMMSSRLGFTAEVIATESPSQPNPVVIQIRCAVIASVSAWLGTNSLLSVAMGPPSLTVCRAHRKLWLTASADPRQRVPGQQVHDPPPAERRVHQHHPGRLRANLADLRGLLEARDRSQ